MPAIGPRAQRVLGNLIGGIEGPRKNIVRTVLRGMENMIEMAFETTGEPDMRRRLKSAGDRLEEYLERAAANLGDAPDSQERRVYEVTISIAGNTRIPWHTMKVQARSTEEAIRNVRDNPSVHPGSKRDFLIDAVLVEILRGPRNAVLVSDS